MRLRTFTATDMQTAMNLARQTLGDDAVILSSGKRTSQGVSVTAAIDADQRKAPVVGSEDLRFEIQNILRFHNVPEMIIAKLMQKAIDRDMQAATALHRISGNHDTHYLHRLAMEKLLSAYFSFEPFAFSDANLRIMLIGTPGAGKTLTIAKLAARMAMDKQPLTVITTDNKRAGGIEQLKAFTDILGLELHVARSQAELLKYLQTAVGRVLVDTAGCNPYESEEMRELAILASTPGVEPVLVMPAGGDSLEAIDAAETFSVMHMRRVLLTRVDTARRFGGILAVAAAYDLAFANASYSASIIDPLAPADATQLAELLLRYQSQP